jgi:hypothetical protein
MLRKLLWLLCATAFTLVACGRQVTPDRQGVNGSGLLPGTVQIRFRTKQQLDFTGHRYIIAFNTSGTGGEPYLVYANAQANYRDLSFEIVVGGNGGAAQAQAYQVFRQPGLGGIQQGTLLQLSGIANQLILDPNSNGLNTEFSLTFDRTILYGYGSTPPPSPSGSPSGSPSPSPVPTATSTGSASPSPSPTASTNAPPTTAPQAIWYVNWWSTDAATNPQDAPGVGGLTDTTFQFTVNTSASNDNQYTVAPGSTQATDPSAQITGGEVANSP